MSLDGKFVVRDLVFLLVHFVTQGWEWIKNFNKEVERDQSMFNE